MQMNYKKHVVNQGECISSIAFDHGLLPESIWNDPQNEPLRTSRENSNSLLPGDVVFIRDKNPKYEAVATQKRHRFRRKSVPEKLVIRFMRNRKPRRDERYEIDIDGRKTEGVTDGEGCLHALMPPDARIARVKFLKLKDQHVFKLGHLNPVTEISGIQGRLQNLGFYFGESDGKTSDALTEAIRDFQAVYSAAEVTGALNEKTRNRISEIYGG